MIAALNLEIRKKDFPFFVCHLSFATQIVARVRKCQMKNAK